MVTEPQESLPVAVPVAAGSVDSLHSTVVFAGAEIVGGVVLAIVIVCELCAFCPQLSVIVYVLVTIIGHVPVELSL